MRKIFIVLVVMLAGCSSIPLEERSDPRDPHENANRKIFEFNLAVDDYFLEPVAEGYRSLPEGAQQSLTNFARWTSRPSTAVNSALQGKFENGAVAVVDFVMNGLTLGLFDLTKLDDKVEREDFGQTMAVWNVPQGNYVMAPFFGPGTVRSHFGSVVDILTNPLGFVDSTTAETIRLASAPTSIVTFRGNNYEQFNDIKYNSIDPYGKTRSFYFQYREGQISGLNSAAPSDADKAFDEFLDDE